MACRLLLAAFCALCCWNALRLKAVDAFGGDSDDEAITTETKQQDLTEDAINVIKESNEDDSNDNDEAENDESDKNAAKDESDKVEEDSSESSEENKASKRNLDAKKNAVKDASKRLKAILKSYSIASQYDTLPTQDTNEFLAVVLDNIGRTNLDFWTRLRLNPKELPYDADTALTLDVLHNRVARILDRRIRRKDFQDFDLEAIMEKKKYIFPQKYEGEKYHIDMLLSILYWIPYMASAHYKIFTKSPDKISCAVADELKDIRPKIINAFKDMYRRRYSGFEAKSDKDKCEKRTTCQKRDLLYKDPVKNEDFHVIVNQNFLKDGTWHEIIDKRIASDKEDMEKVLTNINKYFDPTICMKEASCQCPPKIEATDVYFKWPKNCFGGENCLHPCGEFPDGKKCYVGTDQGKLSHQECNLVNWQECMKVEKP